MSSFIARFTYHCLVAAIVFYNIQVHSFVLTESCVNHATDIGNAMEDSRLAADASQTSTTTIFGTVWNYFGMLDSLFPGIRKSPTQREYLNDLYIRTSKFATLEVEGDLLGAAGVRAAWQGRFYNNPPWDESLVFSCDATMWEKDAGGGHLWYSSEMDGWYNFGYEVNEICGDGVSTMLGMKANLETVKLHFIVILCTRVLYQTPDKPKIYATLQHTELQSNDRPDGPYTLDQGQPMTEEATLNVQYWLGMTIDQLRSRTLSVYVGRIMLFITMYTNINIAAVSGNQNYVIPELPPEDASFKTFAQVKGLPPDQAVQSLETLSLYMTGARACAVFASIRMGDISVPGFPVTENYVWDENGTLNELTSDFLTQSLLEIDVGGPLFDK